MGDKTIITDPFISPSAARDLKKHAEILTGRPVSLVLNLDPHNDHTRGNQVFFPEADIIGTANARRFIDYFETLTEIVNKEIEKGTDENKIMNLPMPEKYESWLFGGFYQGSLQTLYNKVIEINKKK